MRHVLHALPDGEGRDLNTEPEPAFRIPEGVETAVELVECGNCHAPTPAGDLAGGICLDCTGAAKRAVELTLPPAEPEPFARLIPVDGPPDELEARRERRREVKDAAVAVPQGWLQHAVEAVRTECVRARTGHEFTVDTILDNMERAHAPMPPTTELQGAAALRFVMEEAMKRGWCEATDRKQPSRRDETAGKQLRVYRSTL